MSTFGEKLRRLREEKGLTTRMVGEKFEMSHGQLLTIKFIICSNCLHNITNIVPN